jgi:arabinofuranosyltransferase
MRAEETSTKPNLLVAAMILGFTLLSWSFRFIQDDAFISFRYADNLYNGLGLVFNAGERVEGYTNFLWTLLVYAGLRTGADPIALSQGMGLLMYPVSLWLTYRLGMMVFGKRQPAMLALVLCATNYTYTCYATGGLETHMQSFLFLFAFFLYCHLRTKPTPPLCILLSFVLGLAFLLRMDSAIFIAFLLTASAHLVWKQEFRLQNRVSLLTALGLPAATLAGAWLLWKIGYYGQIMPNTYNAKNPGFSGMVPGLYYIALFVLSYGFFLLALPAFRVRKISATFPPQLWVGLAFVVLWIAYVVKVGGGFMEFRFMVPIMPFISLVIAWLLFSTYNSPATRTGWAVLLIAISAFHSTRKRLYGVETIKGLESHLVQGRWIAAGKALHFLSEGEPVWIATTAAGAIPYYSKLPTVDILGLNDKWIAENGTPTQDSGRKWLGSKPGHQKKATIDYLLERHVNLLIGHPHVVRRQAPLQLTIDDFAKGDYLTLNPAPFPEHARLVGIPIDEEDMLVAVYLTPSPAIEQAIEAGRITAL